LTWASVVTVHHTSPVHWVIDTAPFFLGMGALVVVTRFKKLHLSRQQVEEALRQSEARFHRMASNLPGGMIFQFLTRTDGSMELPYVSPSCRELYGVEPEELQRNPDLLVTAVHPDDEDILHQTRAAATQTLSPWRWEGRGIVNGKIKWFQGAARPERQPNGDILWDGLLMDITDRKHADAALQESEQRFRILSAASPVGIFQTSADGHLLFANESLQHIFELSLEDIAKRSFRPVFHPEDWRQGFELWKKSVRQRQEFTFEFRILTPEGEVHWAHMRSKTVLADDGTLLGHTGTVQDITERKKAKDTINQARQEAEALASLARDLASSL
jgi:PAS domain S-box-containing protein